MPRFQFSMRWLMIAVTLSCVLLFLAVTISDFVPVTVTFAFCCVVPTPIVIIAIYGRGDHQAFAIGALVPWATIIFFRAPAGTFSYFTALFWLVPMCAICGVLAAATRRWLVSQSHD